MPRPSTSRTSQAKPHETNPVGRTDHAREDDRPFAEIRRNVYDVLRLLSQHRWMFFVPFCVVSCAAFIASFYYPRTYSANTGFEVRNDPIMINLPMSAGAASYKYFRNTMVRDLTSAEAMAEVVEGLGLMKDAERNADGALTPDSVRHRDSLARSLSANLAINTNSPSDLIDIVKITYTGPDAKIGKSLVDQVKRTYIRRTSAWIKEFLTSQRDYFLHEAQDAGDELLHAQREETRLRLDNPNVDPTNPGSIGIRLAQLELERRDLLSRKRDCETELNAQRQLLADAHAAAAVQPAMLNRGSADGSLNPRALQIVAQIQELVASMTKLREGRGMTDAHPEMQGLLASKQRLERQLEQLQQPSESPDETAKDGSDSNSPATSTPPASIVADRSPSGVQVAAQLQKIKDIDISIATNEQAIAQLNTAKDQVYDKQEEFAVVLGRVNKARQHKAQVESTLGMIEPALKAVEQDRLLQFSEGQPARGGATPISPKASTVVLLSILVGVVAGIVFVILGELFDNIFRSSGQVASSLGLPILEAIDEIVTPHDRRRLLVYHAVAAPLLVAICLAITATAGTMAYLSLTQPWTYNRVKNIPQAALDLFIERTPQSSAQVPTPSEP